MIINLGETSGGLKASVGRQTLLVLENAFSDGALVGIFVWKPRTGLGTNRMVEVTATRLGRP